MFTTGLLVAVFAWRASVSWLAFAAGDPGKRVAAALIAAVGLASLLMLQLLSGVLPWGNHPGCKKISLKRTPQPVTEQNQLSDAFMTTTLTLPEQEALVTVALSAAQLRELFGSLTESARSLHDRHAGEIRQRAANLDLPQLLDLVRGRGSVDGVP